MKFLLPFLSTLAFASPIFAATFDRCSLAKTMYNLGVPKDELARWTCIAEHVSSYHTGFVGKTNSEGYNCYGIFQFSSKYWCQPANGGFSFNLCKISCNDLLTDDITASVSCARKVLEIQGWTAWSKFSTYCSGKLESINSCFGTCNEL